MVKKERNNNTKYKMYNYNVTVIRGGSNSRTVALLLFSFLPCCCYLPFFSLLDIFASSSSSSSRVLF